MKRERRMISKETLLDNTTIPSLEEAMSLIAADCKSEFYVLKEQPEGFESRKIATLGLDLKLCMVKPRAPYYKPN